MNIRKLLSITLLLAALGFNFGRINCAEIHAFSDYEKCFAGNPDYDKDGRIYIKDMDISKWSEDEKKKFDKVVDKSDDFIGVNSIFCYKLSDEIFGKKITFNDKASVSKDGRFIGAMAYDISAKEKSIDDKWIDVSTCPCCWFGVLYIQDKNNDTIIMAKYVESFEFTQDSKFVDITFKSGIKITFDLDARKEVVALRDYSKKNNFFD